LQALAYLYIDVPGILEVVNLMTGLRPCRSGSHAQALAHPGSTVSWSLV